MDHTVHAGLDQGGIDGLDQEGIDERRSVGSDQSRIGLNQEATHECF